jgi:gas vesicle protein
MAQDSSSGVLWFVAGVAIGASVAILFAPSSGEDTRKTIAKKTNEGRDVLAGSGKEMLERGRELFERARQLTDEAAEMFDKGRKIVENTAANLQQD